MKWAPADWLLAATTITPEDIVFCRDLRGDFIYNAIVAWYPSNHGPAIGVSGRRAELLLSRGHAALSLWRL